MRPNRAARDFPRRLDAPRASDEPARPESARRRPPPAHPNSHRPLSRSPRPDPRDRSGRGHRGTSSARGGDPRGDRIRAAPIIGVERATERRPWPARAAAPRGAAVYGHVLKLSVPERQDRGNPSKLERNRHASRVAGQRRAQPRASGFRARGAARPTSLRISAPEIDGRRPHTHQRHQHRRGWPSARVSSPRRLPRLAPVAVEGTSTPRADLHEQRRARGGGDAPFHRAERHAA
jgi:hypothetical protein